MITARPDDSPAPPEIGDDPSCRFSSALYESRERHRDRDRDRHRDRDIDSASASAGLRVRRRAIEGHRCDGISDL